MFQLFKHLSRNELAWRQAPAFTIAFLIAARFYKLGSFAKEAAAFLVTWFVIDAVIEVVVRRRARRPDHTTSSPSP